MNEMPRSGPVLDLNEPTGPGPYLVITEIMPNPKGPANNNNDLGEFIKIFNAGTTTVNLQGMEIASVTASNNPTSHIIASSVPVLAGQCVILANGSTIPGLNVAYAFPTATGIANGITFDFMELRLNGVTVDKVIVGFAQSNSGTGITDGFSFYLDVAPTVDITTIDNSKIEYVSSTGLAKAPWKKATTAQAYSTTDNGVPNSCNYGARGTVDPITAVTVAPARIAVGQTTGLSATATGGSGTIAYAWSSDNTGVVSVNPATGAITGVSIGTANVTAEAPNGVKGSAVVTVVDGNAVDHMTISLDNDPRLTIGYTRHAFVHVFNVLGTEIYPTITYATADASIATVDSRGYVTARGVPAGLSNVTSTVFATVGDVTVSAPVIVQTPLFFSTVIFRNHTEFGDPVDANPADDIILRKRQYELSYNVSRGGPNWVSWDLNSTQIGTRPRCDCFTADVELLQHGVSEAQLIEDADYLNADGNYDRGHMVQSASRAKTDAEQASTYLMTNILPQASDNNQGPWADFEEYLNDFARAGKEVYIMAGGIYGPSPAYLKNNNRVQIPEYTWKVAVIVSGGAGLGDIDYFDDLQVIAVKMPNIDGVAQRASTAEKLADPTYFKKYYVNVDDIEALTGYDVLSRLPDDIENPIEAGDKVPHAALSQTTSAIVEGSSVSFDATGSSDPDGDALTYTWTFGDGTTDHGATVTHTFARSQATPYTVSLTVRDPLGAWETKTTTVGVSNAVPVASFTVDRVALVSGDRLSLSGSFTDAGINDNPWSWTVNWGDGRVTTGSTNTLGGPIEATQTYATAGTYTVTFTVTDVDGASSTRSTSVQVVRQSIRIDVSPEAINDNDIGNARVKVEAYSDDTFDASLVDLATACIGAVCVDERGNSGKVFAELRDADDDGDLDLVMRFERRALVKSGALASPGSEVIFRADLTDGRQVEGRTTVLVH